MSIMPCRVTDDWDKRQDIKKRDLERDMKRMF